MVTSTGEKITGSKVCVMFKQVQKMMSVFTVGPFQRKLQFLVLYIRQSRWDWNTFNSFEKVVAVQCVNLL